LMLCPQKPGSENLPIPISDFPIPQLKTENSKLKTVPYSPFPTP
jgi:hypothetical protein